MDFWSFERSGKPPQIYPCAVKVTEVASPVLKALGKLRIVLGLIGILLLGIFFGRAIYYSLGLKYPEDRTPIYLTQDLSLKAKGTTYRLAQGNYIPVLGNGSGTYYLSPSLGLDVNSGERRGIGVGGIWIPAKESKTYYVWEYNLTAGSDRRSRKKARKLSMDQNQPEWESLQKPEFYASTPLTSFMERPLVDFRFEVDPAMVKKKAASSGATPTSSSDAAALRAQLEIQYKELVEERTRLDTPEKIKLYNEKAASFQKDKDRLKELEKGR